MIKSLISIFILAVFSLSYFAQSEVDSHFPIKNIYKVSKSVQKLTNSLLNESSADDCSDNDCNHRDHHGAHHCSGFCSMTILDNNTSLYLSTHLSSKTLWYLSHHYKTPILDPSLRPPAYS